MDRLFFFTNLPMVGISPFWKVYGLSSPDLNLEIREERVLLPAGLQTARSVGACLRRPTRGFLLGDPFSGSGSFGPPFRFPRPGGVPESGSSGSRGVLPGVVGSCLRKREW